MKPLSMLVATCLALLPAAACAVTPPDPMDQAELDQAARSVLVNAAGEEAGFLEVVKRAQAVAIFPHVGKGALGIGAAYGTGAYYRHGLQLAGYCDMSQASLGLSLGGQGYVEILCLLTPDAVARFEGGVYSLNAQATAVLFTLDAGVQGRYAPDAAVFIRNEAGLMLDASIGVQEYRYQALWTPKAH